MHDHRCGCCCSRATHGDEKAQTSRELDEDFKRIEQGGAY
jgi:hypothetical protein